MGRSETVLAQALTGYDHSEYQLSTKFTPQIAADGDDPVADMLEQSLGRMGTDYVDLYWIHNPADVARWPPPLIPLLKSGKIKHVSVSNHNMEEIALADQILGEAGFRVEAVQNHYSLLYRNSERAGILDHCCEHDVRFFSYMVLEQGALTGRYSPANPLPDGSSRAAAYNGILPQLQALTDRMGAIGADRGASASFPRTEEYNSVYGKKASAVAPAHHALPAAGGDPRAAAGRPGTRTEPHRDRGADRDPWPVCLPRD